MRRERYRKSIRPENRVQFVAEKVADTKRKYNPTMK